jgi:hypothetical protein
MKSDSNDKSFDPSRLANKYRRAFTWRVSKGGVGHQSETEGLVRLALFDYPDILEDYLYISRKRRGNRLAIAKLQLHMMEDIVVQEKSIKLYKEKLALDPAPPEEAQNFINSQIFMHRLIANTIRQIGDAIAWRGFGYDRFTQRILCSNPVKQTFLAEGTEAELRVWSSINDKKNQWAIFNSLTNCIGIGDVTAIKDNGDVELIEVKTGKGEGSRLVRQRRELRDAAGVLSTGTGVVEGKSITSGSLPIVPKGNLPELGKLLQKAEDNGWSSALVAPHCYVECVDFLKLKDGNQFAAESDEARRQYTSSWDVEMCQSGCSHSLIEFVPNVAPLSIFPFDDRTCIELAIGIKEFTTYINIAEIIRRFESSGWEVECVLGEAIKKTNGGAAMIVKKEGFCCHLPPADYARLIFELLDPGTLVEECELLRNIGPKISNKYSVWTCEGEASQWN